MSIEVNNNVAFINGLKGKYDNKEKDNSIRYGRNAVENNLQYMEAPLTNDKGNVAPILDFFPSEENTDKNIEKLNKFADDYDKYLASLPPLNFEYRYMPEVKNGNIDKKAVLGAAYEEMKAKELSKKEFEDRYMLNSEMTADPIDINKDGKIDVAEYSTTILGVDALSKDGDISKIDGTINSKGMNAILSYTKKANAEAAANLYSSIYNKYDLGSELDSFNPQQ